MSNYFKQIMTYLITSSTENGSGSKIQKGRLVLPISLTMTIDGVGGLRPGDSFRVDYLPKVYRENCYFMTTKVDHNLDKTGWTTDISAVLKVDLLNYWLDKVDRLDSTLTDLADVFKLTNIDLEGVPLGTFGDDQLNDYIKQLDDIMTELRNLRKQRDNTSRLRGPKRIRINGKIAGLEQKINKINTNLKNSLGFNLKPEVRDKLVKNIAASTENIKEIRRVVEEFAPDYYNPIDPTDMPVYLP